MISVTVWILESSFSRGVRDFVVVFSFCRCTWSLRWFPQFFILMGCHQGRWIEIRATGYVLVAR